MGNKEKTTPQKWPKQFTPMSPEEKAIWDEFNKYWLEVLPKYGMIENFNHNYVVKNIPGPFISTLEIGAGIGEHLEYERLSDEQIKNYVVVELRENMFKAFKERFPKINAIEGDCQKHIPFPDGHFDRIIAIHVLEHLPNLPAAIKEMHRLSNKDRGVFSIVIPCEGSLAYTLGRRISAQRLFFKRYKNIKKPYDYFMKREHVNRPGEILQEIQNHFKLLNSTYFPIPLRLEFCNLCIGATFTPK